MLPLKTYILVLLRADFTQPLSTNDQLYISVHLSLSCHRWTTWCRKRSASQQTCCKRRWSLSVINYRWSKWTKLATVNMLWQNRRKVC